MEVQEEAIINSNTNKITSSSSTPTPIPIEKWCGDEYLYKFNGFWFTKTYLESTKKVVQNFKPLPKDVILASFPKTGTTWLKTLLHSIINRSSSSSSSSSSPLILNHPHDLIPSLETKLFLNETADYFIDPPQKARILGTHIPFQILGDILNTTECKIVYITRNPKDTLISLWKFVQKAKSVEQQPWELNIAVEQFCKGVLPFGPYYEHVLAYREESIKRPQKVFLITYEELKQDPNNSVKKMAEFLGCPFGDDEENNSIVEEIVKNCSFEILSNHEVNKSNELPSGFPLPYSSFFRKGQVGDYLNYLDQEMVAKIDDITREKFHASAFNFIYGI